MMQLKTLKERQSALTSFALMTEYDVRDTWFKPRDPVEPLHNLKYRCDAPLYQKMVWRFRSCENEPVRFFTSVDNGNQKLLCKDYKVCAEDLKFFCFTVFSLPPCEIKNKDLWQAHPIEWFFKLNQERQHELVERYNKRLTSF